MILSICIPTYNRVNQLDNCLNSILISKKKVDNFNFEICISDNCSEEDTESIIKKYNKELTIKYNRNEKIKSKLSFKYQYELEQLPNEIDNFQKKILEINNELKDTNLYLDNYDKFTSITKELTTLKDQLYQKEERWLKLLDLQEKYE